MTELIGALKECGYSACSKTFRVVKRGGHDRKFCSNECRVLNKRALSLAVVRYCKRDGCGKKYASSHGGTKFCSKSCSAKVANKSEKRPSRKMQLCLNCGNETTRPKYCSIACSSEARKNGTSLDIESWLQGEIPMSSKSGVLRDAARKFLYEHAGHKCTECGWAEVNPSLGKVPLCVDHIDGDWRNNFISNLKVLCFNCHTLTPTFGSLNVG